MDEERASSDGLPMGGRPLEGLRVVDATTDFAGRLCGRVLADAGATVVWLPGTEGAADAWDRFADLGKVVAEPLRTLESLIDEADVLIYTRQSDHAFDPTESARRHSGLVIGCIPPFGEGPYVDFRSDDVVIAALSGLADCTPGYPDRQEGEIQPPVQSLARLAEFGAGVTASVAVLGALLPRFGFPGGAQFVEVAQLEAVVSMMIMDWGTAVYGGTAPGRRRKARMLEPNLYVKTADGYLVIVATSDRHWAALVDAMGSPPWATDERFATVQARAENIEALHEGLREWAKDNNGQALMEKVQRSGVPCVAVLDLTTSLRSEQVRTLNSLETINGLTLPADPVLINGHRRADRYASRATNGPPPAVVRRTEPSPAPLAGVRIVDLTQMVAGPLASQLLVALGAEVYLVESRRRPVPRMYGPFAGKPEYNASTNFNHVNRGKRSVELDLKTMEGRRLLAALVRRSDIVIENFSKRAAADLGLSYAELQAIRGDIIVASISAFGRSGPWGSYVANHAGVTALTGLASAIPDSEGQPRLVGAIMPDALAGAYMASALLQALMLRARTGCGSSVQISMLDVMMNAMAGLLPTAAAGEPLGTHPARFLRTSEAGKYLAVSERVSPDLVTAVQSMTRAEAMGALQGNRIRSGAVLDILEVIADPHLAARHFAQQIDHPVVGVRPMPGVPWLFDGRRPHLGAAPVLGSHTEAAMRDIVGLSPGEIARLRASGVLN